MKPNYAFNATPEQALRSNRAVLPARVNAALDSAWLARCTGVDGRKGKLALCIRERRLVATERDGFEVEKQKKWEAQERSRLMVEERNEFEVLRQSLLVAEKQNQLVAKQQLGSVVKSKSRLSASRRMNCRLKSGENLR